MAALTGAPFHGEFASADASALTEPNSRITLYGPQFIAGGSAITLGANDMVIVTDVVISSAAILLCQIYDGANNVVDAGEKIIEANMGVNTTFYPDWTIPHYCGVGFYPKVKTSGAGQVNVVIHGTIFRLGS